MPAPATATRYRATLNWDDEDDSGPSGPRETGYEQRYRVVVRRPMGPSRKRLSEALPLTFLAAVVPTLLLLTYVLSWTLAMQAGFYRNKLNDKLQNVKIEQADLQATKRQLQSPGYILGRAEQMGMRKAERRYLQVPAAVIAPAVPQ